MCVHDTAKRALAEAPRARRLPALAPQREPSGRRSRTTEFWGTLRVDVLDDEIVVSLPGTSCKVTYFKRPNSPQLLAKNISQSDDFRTPVRLSNFLARAWHTANDKTRELGWIV